MANRAHWVSALIASVAVAACAEPTETVSRSCDLAADHIEACLPGYVATRTETCDGVAADESARILSLSCSQVFTQTADGKADGVPAIRGIKVRREGNRTYFMVPLSQTWGGDRAALLDETIEKFRTRMGELNASLIAHGVDLGSLLVGEPAERFAAYYTETLENLLGNDAVDRHMATELGRSYGAPRELSTWQRYVLPQAFVAYFSAKFGVNIGIGGGVSATAMIVIQPWLSIAVDHTLAEPIVVGKKYELDVAVMGVPTVNIGGGIGGGVPLRIGLGAVFGPLNRPNEVTGWGIGLSGSAAIPVIGGIHGKFLTILRAPPLFMLLLGYQSGTAAELEVHGNLQKLLDLDKFLSWIDSLVPVQ